MLHSFRSPKVAWVIALVSASLTGCASLTPRERCPVHADERLLDNPPPGSADLLANILVPIARAELFWFELNDGRVALCVSHRRDTACGAAIWIFEKAAQGWVPNDMLQRIHVCG